MHIVIGVLTAVAGLIWALVALRRSGIDLNTFNPFLWYRRHQWKKKYGIKPIYNLADPMDVAAVLLLGVAKCEGAISAQQKQALTAIFEQEFRLDQNQAADLLLASSHLIRDEIYLLDNIHNVLERSAGRFTRKQVDSLLELMQRMAGLEGAPNDEQQKLIAATQRYFAKRASNGTWK